MTASWTEVLSSSLIAQCDLTKAREAENDGACAGSKARARSRMESV